ncbi:CotS family spore coat protein [Paenibacillus sp. strain BS8-2]
MELYQIVPWDHMEQDESSSINLEQYVPPELERLAYEVMKSYDMSISNMQLITSKPDKGGAIWRIDTNHGPRSLKVLHRTPQRSLFSVGAQEYVVGKGARVPGIIKTKEGHNSIEAGGKLWIVTDWIDTLTPVAKIDLEGAKTLCHGLGEFHQWSKGYEPPLEAGTSSRIYKWESQYEKIATKIGWFRHIATAYPNTQASSHLLSVLDIFEQQAKDILKRFQESAYKRMVAKGEAHWGLAHQDYGWSNGQMGPGGIWVIDLDGVAFDLPVRDLRKIITSTMDDMGAWDLEWIRGVIAAYHAANPLDQETFELLWIDMAFPNEFYKHVKEVVFNPVIFMDTELNAILDRVVATETNKWDVLRELEKDKMNYPAGDYPDVTAAPSQPYRYKEFAQGGTSPLLVSPEEGSKKVSVIVKPEGKSRIMPGEEKVRKLKDGKEKVRKLKDGKEKVRKQKDSEEKAQKPKEGEEKVRKLKETAKKKLSKKRRRLMAEQLELLKPAEQAEKRRKSQKVEASEPERNKKESKRWSGSEGAVILPAKRKSGKSAGSKKKSRSSSGGGAGGRSIAAARPRNASGSAKSGVKKGVKGGSKKTAGGVKSSKPWRSRSQKAGVKLFLTAYRPSMTLVGRSSFEHSDDMHGEAAGSEY